MAMKKEVMAAMKKGMSDAKEALTGKKESVKEEVLTKKTAAKPRKVNPLAKAKKVKAKIKKKEY